MKTKTDLSVLTTYGWNHYRAGSNWAYDITQDGRLTVTANGETHVYAAGYWLKVSVERAE